MGLEIAIDELYASGWTALDTSGCHYSCGRAYPGVKRVESEFAAAGYEFSTHKVDLFDCFRAEWRDRHGAPRGGVVGATREEAAVYALAQLRRTSIAANSGAAATV